MRTIIPCRKGSSFLSGKTHFFTGYPDTTMALSDLLQIQRCKLNIFGSIEEEQSSDMDVENDNSRLSEANISDNNNELVKDVRNNSDEDRLSTPYSDNINCDNGDDKKTSVIYNLNTSVVKDNECGDVYSSKCQQKCFSDSKSSSPTSETSKRDESSTFIKEGEPRQHEDIKVTRSQSEIKSGHLVFIVSDQNLSTVLPNSKCSRGVGSKTASPSRFPVIVKIHRQSCERYAVISLTRRRQTLPSVFLRLKRSRVTQSTSNPSRFVVIVDGTEGKSLTFEASTPESASEWMQAFSSDMLQDRQLSVCSDTSPTSCSSNVNELSSEKSPETSHGIASELNSPSPSLKLPSSPFLPVLSESCYEEEEEEEEE